MKNFSDHFTKDSVVLFAIWLLLATAAIIGFGYAVMVEHQDEQVETITAYEYKIVVKTLSGTKVYYSNEPPQAGPNSIMFLDALTNQVKILITPMAIITKNTPIPTE